MDKMLAYLKSIAAGQEFCFIDKEVDTNNVGSEQLLKKKHDMVNHQSVLNPVSNNVSPMIVVVAETIDDNQPKDESLSRDRSAFCILKKFSDIINDSNQQLHEEKVQNRSLATENFDMKVKMENIISEQRNLAEQTESYR